MKNSRVAFRRFLRALCSLVAAGVVALPIVSCSSKHGHSDSASVGFALEIAPAVASIASGTDVQLVAMALYTDGTKLDVTSSVAWSSSDLGVVLVDSGELGGGLASARMPGTATITARLPGVQRTMTLTVTSAALVSIEITPAVPSIAKAATLQFTATGVFTDHSTQDLTEQVVWASSDELIATFAGSAGLATGVDVGNATIYATFSGISCAAVLEITPAMLSSIEITPLAPRLPKGTALQLTATGIYSDGTLQDLTAQATWQSTDTAVAAVSDAAGAKGRVDSVALGQTGVSATFLGVSGATSVEVTEATLDSLVVAPAMPTLAKGTQLSFSATGTFSDGTTQDLTAQAVWESSDPAVCALTNAPSNEGQALALAVGSATVSARFGAMSGATTLSVAEARLDSLEVTPAHPSIAKGTVLAFVATGVFSDGSHQDLSAQVTWSSSDGTVAAVSNADGSRGFGTAMTVGMATIAADFAGKTGSTVLTVSDAALVALSVSPANVELPLGTTHAFVATALFSDGSVQDVTGQASWTSSDNSVSTVSSGVARANAYGSVAIGAMLEGISGSANLTVTGAVLVSLAVAPASAVVAQGYALQFAAAGTYSDASTLDLTGQVTWSSSDPSVATISNAADRGRAFGLAAGQAIITAALQGISSSSVLTVDPKVLVSIELAPRAPAVPKSYQWQFAATGHFSDGSTQDLTALVGWASSDNGRATISNAAGSNGLATCGDPGVCTISFVYQSFSDSTTLTVTHAKPVSTVISPSSVTLAVGQTLQLTALTTFDDGTVIDVTRQRHWTCSHANCVDVENGGPSEGLVTALAPGQSDVTIHVGGANASVHVTVY